MSTTTKNTLATKTVSQGESRYGTPEPQIALRFPKGTSYRVVKAALHKLAAEIELATPANEHWCVNTEDYNESGRVYLELADATPAEAVRDGGAHGCHGLSSNPRKLQPSYATGFSDPLLCGRSRSSRKNAARSLRPVSPAFL